MVASGWARFRVTFGAKLRTLADFKSGAMNFRFPFLTLTLLAICLGLTARNCVAKPSQKFLDAALMRAVEFGDVKKTKTLLARGASANATGDNGMRPLIIAGYINTSPYQEGSPHSFELFKLLLDNGADVNAPNSDGYTALMSVAASGEVRAAKLMLAKGAQINAKDSDGHTPLMPAASSNLEMVKFLVAKGARINEHDKSGVTPLMLATSSSGEGADFTYPDIVQYLLARGADANAKDQNGTTALIRVAQMYSERDADIVEVAKALLAKGADVKARTKNGNTALKWAKVTGKAGLIQLLQRAGARE